ncbi:hypothetical protein NEOLEDRAFT_936276 [Neolentinus lepideus HHB14362 ss-1]|uniref:Uncharacterized protein n=1 Tax=Neolentinus lepideus HHB14362 ss-1 TaxID=1314782 RepID=A0A165NJ34_9AGAM|nr:hypothetical protein NEOLEDRAFT_936276 [Neolentinus lepideus HHB14362 ss-1]
MDLPTPGDLWTLASQYRMRGTACATRGGAVKTSGERSLQSCRVLAGSCTATIGGRGTKMFCVFR